MTFHRRLRAAATRRISRARQNDPATGAPASPIDRGPVQGRAQERAAISNIYDPAARRVQGVRR